MLVIKGKAKLINCCKKNPILSSITRQKYKIASFLAKNGGDINWRGPHSPSALQLVVDQNNVQALEELLRWPSLDPIDYDYFDEEGKNIFHRIAEIKNTELLLRIVRSAKYNDVMVKQHVNETITGRDVDTLPIVLCCPV